MKKAIFGIVVFGIGFLAWRGYSQTSQINNFADVVATGSALIGAKIMNTPTSSMDISAYGLDAIAKREGFSPIKYPDADGYSIGYGHFIKSGENFTEPMPEAFALELLYKDAKIAADAVRGYVKVPLTQNQFDALTSFAFNVGTGAFKRSTLLAKLNAGDYTGAASEFDRWHIPSIVIARRDSEKQQFIG